MSRFPASLALLGIGLGASASAQVGVPRDLDVTPSGYRVVSLGRLRCDCSEGKIIVGSVEAPGGRTLPFAALISEDGRLRWSRAYDLSSGGFTATQGEFLDSTDLDTGELMCGGTWTDGAGTKRRLIARLDQKTGALRRTNRLDPGQTLPVAEFGTILSYGDDVLSLSTGPDGKAVFSRTDRGCLTLNESRPRNATVVGASGLVNWVSFTSGFVVGFAADTGDGFTELVEIAPDGTENGVSRLARTGSAPLLDPFFDGAYNIWVTDAAGNVAAVPADGSPALAFAPLFPGGLVDAYADAQSTYLLGTDPTGRTRRTTARVSNTGTFEVVNSRVAGRPGSLPVGFGDEGSDGFFIVGNEREAFTANPSLNPGPQGLVPWPYFPSRSAPLSILPGARSDRLDDGAFLTAAIVGDRAVARFWNKREGPNDMFRGRINTVLTVPIQRFLENDAYDRTAGAVTFQPIDPASVTVQVVGDQVRITPQSGVTVGSLIYAARRGGTELHRARADFRFGPASITAGDYSVDLYNQTSHWFNSFPNDSPNTRIFNARIVDLGGNTRATVRVRPGGRDGFDVTCDVDLFGVVIEYTIRDDFGNSAVGRVTVASP